MKWIFVALFLLVTAGYWLCKDSSVNEDDIYVNRLVYLKSNKKLFTGVLKISDDASQFYETFDNGVPCGEYAEQQKGGSYIAKDKYIASEKLNYIKKEFVADTMTVSLWQAGGDVESDPWYLSITVLRNDAFFENKNEPSPNDIKKLIEVVIRDTKSFHHTYLVVTFANAVYNATRYCSKEYKIENGQVIEESPAYEEWQLRNGVMQEVI